MYNYGLTIKIKIQWQIWYLPSGRSEVSLVYLSNRQQIVFRAYLFRSSFDSVFRCNMYYPFTIIDIRLDTKNGSSTKE